ncbi:purine-nucleoside phosphorylase [Taibaiella sp. KBW10]|uniref:purine-nucleoside phosphorylase n=1 Tax=Taibaiella sp. KBW10 TaxID=2153357 RepID=UPI000F5A93AB|nr:purine-nucleoside phosphorylase [Taibaiella sp. KBW10]RQO30853.1 purine-nucleoside phosphorylase [Taibaiella sp. KBW10]
MTFEQIQETADYIKSKVAALPSYGVILGSGLGGLTEAVNIQSELSYNTIPNFPQSTVEGHAGKLIFGTIGDKQVVMMAGRFHYYEGYNMQEVTFPVRVMKALGVETLFVSNAAGGMNRDFKIGDIMFIKDHINLFPEHPLRGKNDTRLGTRFPDMSEPYSYEMIAKAKVLAAEAGIEVKEGVYIGLQGPTFETRAEYKWLDVIGGDAVGMSTVPEVIVAIHGGMKVFAASIITDLGIREELNTITHEEVLEAANIAAPKLAKIVSELIKSL